MPFDTDIYKNRGGGAVDFMGAYKEGLNMRDLHRKDKEAQRIHAEEQDMRAAYQRNTSVNPDGTINTNRAGLLSDLNKTNSLKAHEQSQLFKTQDAAEQSAKLDQLIKKADYGGRALGGVYDQASWDRIRPELIKNGFFNENEAPPHFDPNFIKGAEMRTLSVKDRLELQFKRQELAAKKSGGGIGGGKAPQGYRFKPDGSLEPIPGGPAAQAAGNREAKQKQDAGLVVQDIGRSLDLIEKNPAAAGTKDFGLMSYVPGSSAQSLDHLLDSVKSNIGFNKLQAMREASPTGGALGSVSTEENRMLQATAGKLSSYMPEDQLKDNLKRLYNQYNDIIHGPGQGPPRYQLSFDEQGKPVEQRLVKEPQTKTIDGVTYKKVQGGWEEVTMPASR